MTNAYEEIATKLKPVITQFIPLENWPDRVAWLEQYEDRPTAIDLVTMQWDGRKFLTPKWVRLTEQGAEPLGVAWQELCRALP